jgi:hypothetical protein
MSERRISKYFWQIFIALIPVPFTIWLTILFIQKGPNVKYLEYITNTNNGIIALPSELSSDIEIFHKEQKINNLSTVCYRIFNKSGSNFEDVQLFVNIKIDPLNNSRLINSNISGPESYPKYGFKKLSTDDSNTIGWKISNVNMSTEVYEYFQVNLIFMGDKSQETKICVLKSGLDIKPWDPDETKINKKIFEILVTVGAIFLYIIILYVSVRLRKKQRIKFLDKFRAKVTAYFSSSEFANTRADTSVASDRIIAEYMETRKESRSKLDKFIAKVFRLD